nr:protein kinase, ATP binding site-containing protein [Tanacetum cinerariifolium]
QRIGDDKQKPLINLVRRYYDYRPDLLVDPVEEALELQVTNQGDHWSNYS